MNIDELIRKIIGCAYTVYNKMGFGYQESVYENCLKIELRKHNLNAEFQKPIKVHYENENVGDFVADILVENVLIVELKSVISLNKIHEAQLVNYLVATEIDDGLLINFGEQEVEVKRKFRTYTRSGKR
jgi:GxxExxY protein